MRKPTSLAAVSFQACRSTEADIPKHQNTPKPPELSDTSLPFTSSPRSAHAHLKELGETLRRQLQERRPRNLRGQDQVLEPSVVYGPDPPAQGHFAAEPYRSVLEPGAPGLLTSSSDHSQIGIDAAKSTKGKSTEHSARKVDNAADLKAAAAAAAHGQVFGLFRQWFWGRERQKRGQHVGGIIIILTADNFQTEPPPPPQPPLLRTLLILLRLELK